MKLILMSLLFTLSAQAKTIKVAVIDTGFDFKSTWENSIIEDQRKRGFDLVKPKLCPTGHYSFVQNNDLDLQDNHGHGTHIAGIIAQGNENVDYCLVILKYYDPKVPNTNNLRNTVEAVKQAVRLKVDIMNYSGGGTEESQEECKQIKLALNAGIKIIAAAGNEHSELVKHPYYPAMCDPRVIKAVNINKEGKVLPSSNRDSSGKIPNVRYIRGENILSLVPGNQASLMTGTSQSAAEVTKETIHSFNQDLLIREKYLQSYK